MKMGLSHLKGSARNRAWLARMPDYARISRVNAGGRKQMAGTTDGPAAANAVWDDFL